MGSYCSLYVDAGYLITVTSTKLTRTYLRSDVDIDIPGLLAELTTQVEPNNGLPLLRIHCYNAGRLDAPALQMHGVAS